MAATTVDRLLTVLAFVGVACGIVGLAWPYETDADRLFGRAMIVTSLGLVFFGVVARIVRRSRRRVQD